MYKLNASCALLVISGLVSLWHDDDWHDLLTTTMVTCHTHTNVRGMRENERDLRSKLQFRFMECRFTV